MLDMNSALVNFLKTVSSYLVEYSIRIVIAMVILFIGFKLSNILVKKYPNFKGQKRMSPEASSFIKSVIGIVSKVLIIIAAIAIVGIPIASVITVLASAGVAIGLAIQGSLANVAGGVIIVMIKPFRVGDTIVVENCVGTVSAVDIFYTRLVTFDNKEILIPNGRLMNSPIENITAFDYRRVELVFSAGYECDSNLVKNVILVTAQKQPFVILEDVNEAKAPFVAVSRQGESCIEYTLRVWCKKENYSSVMYGINESMKTAFDENNITIPFKQLDIHVIKD